MPSSFGVAMTGPCKALPAHLPRQLWSCRHGLWRSRLITSFIKSIVQTAWGFEDTAGADQPCCVAEAKDCEPQFPYLGNRPWHGRCLPT